MYKKLLCMFLVFSLFVGTVGCAFSQSILPENTFTAGTYTASVDGHNGLVTIEATFTADSIQSIAVLESSETVGLGDNALNTVADQIIANQTWKVDTLTGATISSQAMIDAVKDCILQAGAEPDLFSKIDKNASSAIEKECDIVVVGGGIAGLSAALVASERGADVILLEKTAVLGGNTLAAGGGILCADSDYQRSFGWNTTPSEFYEFIMETGLANDTSMVQMWADNIGKSFDWFNATFKPVWTEQFYDQNRPSKYDPKEAQVLGGGSALAPYFESAAENSDVEILMNTWGTGIIENDGIITGVTATNANGDSITILAQSVILATGGFGGNQEMMDEYLPNVVYTGLPSTTGEGILWGMELGARTQKMDVAYGSAWGLMLSKPFGKKIRMSMDTGSSGIIGVDASGIRRANEDGFSDVFDYEKASGVTEYYLIIDENAWPVVCKELVPSVWSEDELQALLTGEQESIIAYGDTLETAAAYFELDPQVLSDTIHKFNEGMLNDSDAFGHAAGSTISENGPYYIIKTNPYCFTTNGGLKINPQAKVMLDDTTAFDNLYAVGNVTGGQVGNSDPSGGGLSWAQVSGYVAGVNAASALSK